MPFTPSTANLWGGPGRIPGIDIARGLAVLGMFTAHVGVTSDDFTTLPGWLSLAHGRSSILFAMIAGVSLAIISGGRDPLDGLPALRARTRILVRAVMLLGLVGLLDLLGTSISLILGFYAAFFVLALPFLRWPPARLLALAAVIGLAGPPLVYWGPEALNRAGLHLPQSGSGALTDFLLTGGYPGLVWMAYVLAGLAIGRMDLGAPAVRAALVTLGALTMLLAYTVSGVGVLVHGGAEQIVAESQAHSSELREEAFAWNAPWPTADFLLLAGPHTDTPPEVFGSGGFAVTVLGLCLYAGRIGTRLLAPVAAVGSMALTVYSLQIVAIWAWEGPLMAHESNWPLLVMVLASLGFATTWRWLLGRGPLERLFAHVARRASDMTPHVRT